MPSVSSHSMLNPPKRHGVAPQDQKQDKQAKVADMTSAEYAAAIFDAVQKVLDMRVEEGQKPPVITSTRGGERPELEEHLRRYVLQQWDPLRAFLGVAPGQWATQARKDFGLRIEELHKAMATKKPGEFAARVNGVFVYKQSGKQFLYRNSVFFQLLERFGEKEVEFAAKVLLLGTGVPGKAVENKEPNAALGAGAGHSSRPSNSATTDHLRCCDYCSAPKLVGQLDVFFPEDWYCQACFSAAYGFFPWKKKGREELQARAEAFRADKECAGCDEVCSFGRTDRTDGCWYCVDCFLDAYGAFPFTDGAWRNLARGKLGGKYKGKKKEGKWKKGGWKKK